MQIARFARALAAAALLVSCNGILGIGENYHLATNKDGGSIRGCTSSAQCDKGEICLFQTCERTCRKDGDCPPGSRCLNTDEGAACVTPSLAACGGDTCPKGTECFQGQCRSSCVDAVACATDQVCASTDVCIGTRPSRDPLATDGGVEAGVGAGGSAGNGGAGGSGSGDAGTGGSNADASASCPPGTTGPGCLKVDGSTCTEGTECTDGIDACDATGKCNAAGTCIGQNDACGSRAASCATCTSGAGCFQGRDCTCTGTDLEVSGKCLQDTDECATKPCDPIATCSDPTPDGSISNDFICTCPAGYKSPPAGSGACADIDECATANPCGAGRGTCKNTLGSYTCTCDAGFASVPAAGGPTCACDMSGTWGLTITRHMGFPAVTSGPITTIEGSPAGGVTTTSWELRYDTVAADGTVTVQSVPCGGTVPVLCATAFQQAYGQYTPVSTYSKAAAYAGASSFTTTSVNTFPSGTYVEPQHAVLLGITLADPMGAWPPCWRCVGPTLGQFCTCTGSTQTLVTNAAKWADSDADTLNGVTVLAVPLNGQAITGAIADPPIEYPATSECPRIATPHATYGFHDWANVTAGGASFRTYRWQGASRTISGLQSTSITAGTSSCTIVGNVTGPASGHTELDSRVVGCTTCATSPTTSCTPSGASCSPTEVDASDVPNRFQVLSETFSLSKQTADLGATLALPESTTKQTTIAAMCESLRTATCPAGSVCN